MTSVSYTKNKYNNLYTKGLNAEAENTLFKKTSAPKAEAKVNLAEAGYSNKKLGVSGSVKLGGAGASFGSTTGAEVYAVKYEGSVSGKVGKTNIKFGGEASLASAGAEVGLSISKKSIKFKTSLSLGVGGGFSIEISR